MHKMAEELAQRLSNVKMRGRLLTLKVMKRAASAPIEPAKVGSTVKLRTFT